MHVCFQQQKLYRVPFTTGWTKHMNCSFFSGLGTNMLPVAVSLNFLHTIKAYKIKCTRNPLNFQPQNTILPLY